MKGIKINVYFFLHLFLDFRITDFNHVILSGISYFCFHKITIHMSDAWKVGKEDKKEYSKIRSIVF